jgi:hypothetical protein
MNQFAWYDIWLYIKLKMTRIRSEALSKHLEFHAQYHKERPKIGFNFDSEFAFL